jgi:hypothetical protein
MGARFGLYETMPTVSDGEVRTKPAGGTWLRHVKGPQTCNKYKAEGKSKNETAKSLPVYLAPLCEVHSVDC